MHSHLSTKLLLLLTLSQRVVSAPRDGAQVVIAPPTSSSDNDNIYANDAIVDHAVDDSILAALSAHSDPVDALLSLQPQMAAQLAEPRLIHVLGQPKPEWMTEGDKLHLRRERKKFMDITDHQDLYAESGSVNAWAGEASKMHEVILLHFRC